MAVLRFTLNGRTIEAPDVDPHCSLLDLLRSRGLTGSKEGCAEGECGACAVVVVRPDGDGGARYEPVNSCLLLACAVDGLEVVTVEGVARDGELHPVQRAMVDGGGSQCGYCTPGFVMSMFAEYYRTGRDGFDPESIGGNLCRCTGYRPIRDAMRSVGEPADDDPFRARLTAAAPSPGELAHEHAGRSFHRPTSLGALLALRAEHPEAKLICGGTDVVVEMNQLDRRWPMLVSVEAVPELGGVTLGDDVIEIGAAVPLTTVEERLAGRVPILAQLFPLFSSRLIRNRATLGGNLVNASPIGDSPPALLALDAEVRLASRDGERVLPLSELFTGYRQTALGPTEVLRSVRIPLPMPTIQRFYKVSKRVMDDISTVAAGFSLDLDAEGRVTRARLAYGGVAATPARATAAEDALVGQRFDRATVDRIRPLLASAFTPMTDHRGSESYRRVMVERLVDKLLADVAGGGGARLRMLEVTP